jgi:hypothetical protein
MSSKLLFFPMFLILLISLSSAELESRNVAPVIHFLSAVADPVYLPPISITIKDGSVWKATAELSGPGKEFQFKVDAQEKNVYFANVVFGKKYSTFPAYDPAKDSGRVVIYFRADNLGWARSYDNTTFQNVSPWKPIGTVF